MLYYRFYSLVLFIVFLGIVCGDQQKVSPCLEECLEPIVKIEKSISYIYRNYDSVCETLEKSAKCSQRCTQQDQSRFFQYTTFHRVHCVEFEEELENVLPCLKEASYKADVVCRGKCTQKSDDKRLAKEEKQHNFCKTVECATICYYKQFLRSCFFSKDLLLKLNIRIVEESRRLTLTSEIEKFDPVCQRIHNPEYLRAKLIEAQKQTK